MMDIIDIIIGWILAPIYAVIFITVATVGFVFAAWAVLWWFLFIFGCVLVLLDVIEWSSLISFLTFNKS